MTQKFSFFFSLLFTLPLKVQAANVIATLSQGNFVGAVEDLFSSKANILFFSFFVIMAYGYLFPSTGSKEDL